jgi:DNA (cytosine-5)-methyltransferase 1
VTIMKREFIFRLGELFCGPGGMAIAAHLTKPVQSKDGSSCFSITHSWGVDRSKPAIDTFNANLGGQNGAEGIFMDATEFVKKLGTEHEIDALAFGFPCNSFSMVGEKEGVKSEKFGLLYKAGIRVIEKYNPQWFIAENVSGINSHDSGKQFRTILQELSNSGKGYNVVAHLYKFEEYGVPQSRHRYVIVGIRSDIAAKNKLEFRIPAPTHGKGRKNFVSVQEALKSVKNKTSWGGELTRQSDQVVWRLNLTPPGQNAWNLDEIITWEDNRLLAYFKKNLPWYDSLISPLGGITKIREKMEYARLHVTKARMSHIYKRLEADKPSYTLTGSGGGGTHVYHWEEPRALTNEERAALQTFPKDFVFCGSKEEVRKQIGMAVPTQGAKVIFEAILKTFAKLEYDSVPAKPDLIFKPAVV